jgi:hypothetical protein
MKSQPNSHTRCQAAQANDSSALMVARVHFQEYANSKLSVIFPFTGEDRPIKIFRKKITSLFFNHHLPHRPGYSCSTMRNQPYQIYSLT